MYVYCFSYCNVMKYLNHIGGVMVSLIVSRAVDLGFEQMSGQTKDYNIGICCFSADHVELRSKNKDWLARNHDMGRMGRHVYPRTVVSVSQHYKYQSKTCWSNTQHPIISSNITCSLHDIAETLPIYLLNKIFCLSAIMFKQSTLSRRPT